MPGTKAAPIWMASAPTTETTTGQLFEKGMRNAESVSERQLKTWTFSKRTSRKRSAFRASRSLQPFDSAQTKKAKLTAPIASPETALSDDHQPVEDRLVHRARRAVQQPVLARLEGERHVLSAIRHEVQPEKLHGAQGQRLGEQCREQEDHHLRRAGRDQEIDDLADVGVSGAPLLDAGDDGGEIVVGDDEVGGVARHVGAALPHGDAEVGAAERRRIVHAVAGHCDDVAGGFQSLHDVDLLRRLDAGEDLGLGKARLASLRRSGERHDLAAGSDFAHILCEAEFARDGERRHRMVARNHADRDAGRPARGDRFARLGPQRIDEPDEREQRQADELRLDVGGRERPFMRHRLRGDGDHAKPLLGHALGGEMRIRAAVFAQRQNHFRRTLRVKLQPVAVAV